MSGYPCDCSKIERCDVCIPRSVTAETWFCTHCLSDSDGFLDIDTGQWTCVAGHTIPIPREW